MFTFKNKNLTFFITLACVTLLISVSILAVRVSAFNIFKFPLEFLSFVQREVKGVIFYHRNMAGYERLLNYAGLLQQRVNQLQEEHLENVRLKEMLSFKQQAPFKVLIAKVIGRASDSWASTIIIDKGSIHGVRKGMAVMDYGGLLGKVVETAQLASKVMLLNDPNLGVSAIVQRSRQEGLISGTLGDHLIMRYLPEDADIKEKDVIVTSGMNEAYPKGILIGTVAEINKEFSGLSCYAIIRPVANLSHSEEVLVIFK